MEFARFEQAEGLIEQRELFDDAFPENRGASAASVEHYLWKFHGGPFDPTSYEYQATENGKMLGYYAAIPYPYQLGERKVFGGMVCDVMTHSQARGRGVFTELGSFSLAEMRSTSLSFLTGYPIRPEVMGGHLRVGWQVAFELPMYLRPLRSNAILRLRHLSLLAPIANIGIAAYRMMLRTRPDSEYAGRIGAARELFCGPAFETFIEKWSAGIRNHLRKGMDFYAWRLSAPGTNYQALLIYRDGAIVAAAVGRKACLHGIPSFALLDIMVLKGEEAALAALYRDLDDEARRQGAEAIVTMMSRRRAQEYRLKRFGFLKSPFVFKLILHSLDDEIPFEAISGEDDWHLMWIDSDDL
jgi:Acetyltransferase (GNAT) domain